MSDYDDVQRWDGIFVGMLTPEEVETFERCVERGEARRSYEGAGGFMGLAKVRVNPLLR